jgi:aspartyl aminopeptidase
MQGADSELLSATISRICKCLGVDEDCLLSQSFMVSADNAHAVHPNHPELADFANAPVMNGGVVLKFNASQRYITDGASASVFRKICYDAGVPVQTYYNRPDIPGGRTLGRISLNHVSVPTVDVGLPQLAMHSCYETAGVQDSIYLETAMSAFYGTTLEKIGDQTYVLK